jgi:tRNA-2-methylthio-N6-dimethylallyladenosine synthase
MALNNTYIPIESLTESDSVPKNNSRLYVETYGCQMNFADTEIVNGIMAKNGFETGCTQEDAGIILLNTCSIRENAESKIYQRLSELKVYKKKNPGTIVGIIGCMAERLKRDMLSKTDVVDLILGPDEYRKLPSLIDNLIDTGEKGIAVRLSRVETYDDIMPVRKEGISAWLSVIRGCDKFCTFCVVPYTRGRERSRTLEGIVAEVKQLRADGFKEVNLLGQNVNSYRSGEKDFADLLETCAKAAPEMRIKFTTSHPQDLSLKLIETISNFNNLCNYIHLPIQSGSNRILELMGRTYTVEHYMKIIDNIKKIIPDATITTDIIAGFCTETEEDHKMTLDVMNEVRYDGAYMFKYSPREKTKAWNMKDDVAEEIKSRRLMEIIELQNNIALEKNKKLVGNTFEIIIEGRSKKSAEMLTGRTDGNKSVIIPKNGFEKGRPSPRLWQAGEKVRVKITGVNSATLFGEAIG